MADYLKQAQRVWEKIKLAEAEWNSRSLRERGRDALMRHNRDMAILKQEFQALRAKAVENGQRPEQKKWDLEKTEHEIRRWIRGK